MPEGRRPSEALASRQLLDMYWCARLAREIEERLVILFRQSKVSASTPSNASMRR